MEMCKIEENPGRSAKYSTALDVLKRIPYATVSTEFETPRYFLPLAPALALMCDVAIIHIQHTRCVWLEPVWLRPTISVSHTLLLWEETTGFTPSLSHVFTLCYSSMVCPRKTGIARESAFAPIMLFHSKHSPCAHSYSPIQAQGCPQIF